MCTHATFKIMINTNQIFLRNRLVQNLLIIGVHVNIAIDSSVSP